MGVEVAQRAVFPQVLLVLNAGFQQELWTTILVKLDSSGFIKHWDNIVSQNSKRDVSLRFRIPDDSRQRRVVRPGVSQERTAVAALEILFEIDALKCGEILG